MQRTGVGRLTQCVCRFGPALDDSQNVAFDIAQQDLAP